MCFNGVAIKLTVEPAMTDEYRSIQLGTLFKSRHTFFLDILEDTFREDC